MSNGSGMDASDDGSIPEPFFDDGVDPFAPPVEPAATAAPAGPWHPAYQLQPPVSGYPGYAPAYQQPPVHGYNYSPPPAGAGGPPPGYGPYWYPPVRRTSGLAIASLVCSCVGLVLYAIPSVVGLILGICALRSIKAHPEQSGHGMALAGVIVGAIAILLWAIGITILVVLINNGTISDDGNGGSLAVLLTHGRALG